MDRTLSFGVVVDEPSFYLSKSQLVPAEDWHGPGYPILKEEAFIGLTFKRDCHRHLCAVLSTGFTDEPSESASRFILGEAPDINADILRPIQINVPLHFLVFRFKNADNLNVVPVLLQSVLGPLAKIEYDRDPMAKPVDSDQGKLPAKPWILTLSFEGLAYEGKCELTDQQFRKITD